MIDSLVKKRDNCIIKINAIENLYDVMPDKKEELDNEVLKLKQKIKEYTKLIFEG